MQYEQMGIACNDDVSFSVDREFEKLVVGWAPACSNALDDRHILGPGKQLAKPIHRRRRNQSSKIRAREDAEKLRFGCG